MNVKVVVAALSIGPGNEQLWRFYAILCLPTLMHHKDFITTSEKVHAGAVGAGQ